MIIDILRERAARYGKSFLEQSTLTKHFKDIMRRHRAWETLAADQQEAMEFFAVKQARILNGDPNYPDNWRDIEGYAKLVADRLEGK